MQYYMRSGVCYVLKNYSRQHRTIPALRLKHRSGGCGTASALPKCSIMSGCGTRIVLRGQAPSHSETAALLRFAVSATGGAHLCSIQYYLRFWLGICRTSLAVSALRIMRYCPKNPSRLPGIFAIRLHRCAAGAILFTEPMRKEVANAMNDAELDSLMGKGVPV